MHFSALIFSRSPIKTWANKFSKVSIKSKAKRCSRWLFDKTGSDRKRERFDKISFVIYLMHYKHPVPHAGLFAEVFYTRKMCEQKSL